MQRYYSPSTGCTYLPSIHGEQIPTDAVAISEVIYRDVIANPPPGMVRSHAADGTPILVDTPAVAGPTRGTVEAARLRAYADPLTGSDRYFSEANREVVLGNTDNAEHARLRGLQRFTEIQQEHPWPETDDHLQ